MHDVALKNPTALAERLDLSSPPSLLLVDPPASLQALADAQRPPGQAAEVVEADAIRSVKSRFEAIIVWRENRIGSRSLFDAVVKRLASPGAVWVVTAMKKVMGPSTPAVHRLELSDLEKAFAAEGLVRDRETRVSAWHVGYRFVRRETEDGKRKT
ncbi:MAG TPA: hypothetical protein VKJ00_11590 [Thermoanaerobaculia bacterium]|nr:hypothetical protein [Thermoanaerobaculia bacterium]